MVAGYHYRRPCGDRRSRPSRPRPAESSPEPRDHDPRGIGVDGVAGVYGVIVTEVIGRPAQGAGLKIGDAIIDIDDKPITTITARESAVGARAPGSKIKLTYFRNGIATETTVALPNQSDPKQVALFTMD
jgi:S1-C subfamily serine protease